MKIKCITATRAFSLSGHSQIFPRNYSFYNCALKFEYQLKLKSCRADLCHKFSLGGPKQGRVSRRNESLFTEVTAFNSKNTGKQRTQYPGYQALSKRSILIFLLERVLYPRYGTGKLPRYQGFRPYNVQLHLSLIFERKVSANKLQYRTPRSPVASYSDMVN